MNRPVAARWTPALVTLGLLLGVVLITYRDTGAAMVAIWSRSDTFAHAFLVPPIAAWLIWGKRRELAACMPRPAAWMLLPIGVASSAWLLSDLAAVNALAQLAFTALLVFVTVAVIGTKAGRVIAFPLLFLFFAVPIGEFLLPQMMQWTADFTVLALRLSGIPVYREGLQFVVPSGNWSVVEACSGIRYLIASIMVGTLFAYLNYRSLRRRLIFVGISVVVPIVANWVRAYLIVLIGDLSGNVAAVSADHLIYGWIFFGVVITLMFLIGSRWSEARARRAPRAPRHASRRAMPGDAARVASKGVRVAVGALVLCLLPALALRQLTGAERQDAPRLAMPAVMDDGWRRVDGALPPWKPAFAGAAAEFEQLYTKDNDTVGLYVGYYRRQHDARKLVSSENKVVTLNDPAWSMIDAQDRRVVAGGIPLDVRATHVRASSHVAADTSEHRLIWQLYWINGTLTADERLAKVYAAFYRLLGRGDDAAVIFIHTNDSGGGSADARLASFLDANLAPLVHVLTRTRDEPQPAPRGRRSSAASGFGRRREPLFRGTGRPLHRPTRRGRAAAPGWLRSRFELNRAGADGHLASMEGLRGFAVALVFLVHYATLVQPWVVPDSPTADVLRVVHRIGNAGVDLFFVLSGFLIYGALMRGPVRFGSYFRRRLRRIYPPFLCVFGVYLLLSVLVPSQSKLPGDPQAAAIYVLENLLLLPGVLPIEPVITVAWSLSYELLYYLAMPALIPLFGLKKRSPAWRSAFFCGLALAAACLAPPGSPLRLVMFLAGVLLHEALETWPGAAPHSGFAFLATIATLAVVALPSADTPIPVKLIVLFVGFFILCFACFARGGALVSRLFCTTGLRWLGNMSYSYYLVHGLALKAVFLVLGRLVSAPQAALWPAFVLLPIFVSTLVPAALLFLCIERPLSLRSGRPAAAPSRRAAVAETM